MLYVRVCQTVGEKENIYKCVQQQTEQSNHSHSFRSITFSLSRCVRPLTDTLGCSGGTHTLSVFNIQGETGAGSHFVG